MLHALRVAAVRRLCSKLVTTTSTGLDWSGPDADFTLDAWSLEALHLHIPSSDAVGIIFAWHSLGLVLRVNSVRAETQCQANMMPHQTMG